MGKRLKREGICIWLILVAVRQKPTQSNYPPIKKNCKIQPEKKKKEYIYQKHSKMEEGKTCFIAANKLSRLGREFNHFLALPYNMHRSYCVIF